jgi:hypothetical protein
VDSKGRRTAVVLPIADYDAILQELQDFRDAQYVDQAEATAEGFVEVGELRRGLSRKAS